MVEAWKRKIYRFIQTKYCHSTFQTPNPCASSALYFLLNLLTTAVILHCKTLLPGLRMSASPPKPQAGLPSQPAHTPTDASSSLSHSLPRKALASGTDALQGNKQVYSFDAYILQLRGAGATWKQCCFIMGSYSACCFSVLLSQLICFKDAGWNRRSRQSWEILDAILTLIRR